jgi:hypothetical protein
LNMKAIRVAILSGLILALSGSAAKVSAQVGEVTLEALATLGGMASAVAIQDDLAYLALGAGLQVVDLSAPGGPALVGVASMRPRLDRSSIIALSVEAGHAFALSDLGRLRVFDLGIAGSPREIASLSALEHASDFALFGGLAVVVGRETSVVVDVSTPARPVILTSLGRPASAVAMLGDRVALAGPDLAIYDLRSPNAPELVAELPLAGVQDLAIDADFAYLTGDRSLLDVVDLTRQPVLIAHIPASGSQLGSRGGPGCIRIGREDEIVFVSNCFTGEVQIFDIAFPERPLATDRLEAPAGLGSLDAAMQDRRLVLALGDREPGSWSRGDEDPADSGGLVLFELSDAGAAQARGHYRPFYKAGYELALVGRNTLLADAHYLAEPALHVIDVSAPELPEHRARLALGEIYAIGGSPSSDLALVAARDENGAINGYLVKAGGSRSAEVVAKLPLLPSGPTRVGVDSTNHVVIDIEMEGDRAYWLEHWYEGQGKSQLQVRVFDLSRPGSPLELPAISLDGMDLYPRDMALGPGWLYLATGSGLVIVDIRDPDRARLASRVNRMPAFNIRVAGDRAYLSLWREDNWVYLDIVDIRDPERPRLLSITEVTADVTRWQESNYAPVPAGLDLAGDLLIFGLFDMGLVAYDVSDPHAPRLRGSLDVGGLQTLRVDGCLVYATASQLGLVSVAIQRFVAPVVSPRPTPERAGLSARIFLPAIERHRAQDYCYRSR